MMPETSSSSSSSFAEQIVVFLVFVVFDLDILDARAFIGIDHRHAFGGLRLFFFGLFLFVFAGGGHVQGRFLDGFGLLFLFGLGLAVIIPSSSSSSASSSGLHGAHRTGRLERAAALLEERFRVHS